MELTSDEAIQNYLEVYQNFFDVGDLIESYSSIDEAYKISLKEYGPEDKQVKLSFFQQTIELLNQIIDIIKDITQYFVRKPNENELVNEFIGIGFKIISTLHKFHPATISL